MKRLRMNKIPKDNFIWSRSWFCKLNVITELQSAFNNQSVNNNNNTLTLNLPGGEGGPNGPTFKFECKKSTKCWIFLSILNLCIFSLSKCEWNATKNICQKLYNFERRGKLNMISNFDQSLSSFRVNFFFNVWYFLSKF